MYTTDQREAMQAETVDIASAKGDKINAYFARPTTPGKYPGMVLIHHAPGWDEWYKECTRRFAHHGYITITPNLYFRDGHGTPEDVGAKVRAAFPMARFSAISKAPSNLFARSRISTAKSASLAPAPAAATVFSPPANSKASTRWSSAGVAGWRLRRKS